MIRNLYIPLVKLILFWIVIFNINRIIFYICTNHLLNNIDNSLILQSFYHAFRLDLSMVAYVTIAPLLLLVGYFISNKLILINIYNKTNIAILIIYNIISFGECGLYREWKAKLSVQALMHFSNPEEVFKSASLGLTLLFFSLVIIFSVSYIYIYQKLIAINTINNFISTPKRILYFSIMFLFSAFIWVIMARGGFAEIPIQSSDSFFCKKAIINDAAVNPLWNISFDIISYAYHGKENPFKVMDNEEAEKIVKQLYSVKKDSTEIFLANTKPNIVFIILESWSANCVKIFGGDDFAPFVDSLSRTGIYFTNFYPAGYVSDQGIPAILSSFPCTSRIAVINQSSKSLKLPCINQDLKPIGYKSGFIFGGDLNYGNIRSYVYNKEWDLVKEEADFPKDLEHGNLGIQDKDMAKEFLKSLNKAPNPFVYSWFTVSSHMPYDYTGERKKITDKENEYVNSIVYTDKALKYFFTEAKKQSWFNNTLFVLVADHSHDSHRSFEPAQPEYHKIPMLFYGNVIKEEYRGRKINKVFSQLDIVPSILYQMGLSELSKQYVWGKNMFNPYTPGFSYYCSFGTGGFINEKDCIAYQHQNEGLIVNTSPLDKQKSDSLTKIAKAYQQMVYEDFMNR